MSEREEEIIALGQVGWSLRRIENATGVGRETSAEYLKAAVLRKGTIDRVCVDALDRAAAASKVLSEDVATRDFPTPPFP